MTDISKELMCIINIKKKYYLVDRASFHLLCSLQDVKFGFDDEIPTSDDEKEKMYNHVITWLMERNRAIKLFRNPTHLTIKFIDE